jgi:hypothetical protein
MLGHRSYENSSERQKALSAFLTAKVPDTSPEGLERLRRLLFYLFPAMFGAGLGPTGEQQRSRMQRISSELYFDRYFRYGVGDDDLADRELDTTLADVETSNDSEAGQSWERLLSDVPADVLIEKIRLRINELTAAGSARLALYLARAGSRFPFDGFSLWHSRSLFQNAATAIAALLLHITTPEGRREASAVVMQEVRPLPLGALVLEFLEKLSAAADGVSLTPAEGVDHCSAAAGMPRPV